MGGVDWFPLSTQTAKVVLQYNLSTVYAMRGEYDKAGELVRQVLHENDLPFDY